MDTDCSSLMIRLRFGESKRIQSDMSDVIVVYFWHIILTGYDSMWDYQANKKMCRVRDSSTNGETMITEDVILRANSKRQGDDGSRKSNAKHYYFLERENNKQTNALWRTVVLISFDQVRTTHFDIWQSNHYTYVIMSELNQCTSSRRSTSKELCEIVIFRIHSRWNQLHICISWTDNHWFGSRPRTGTLAFPVYCSFNILKPEVMRLTDSHVRWGEGCVGWLGPGTCYEP